MKSLRWITSAIFYCLLIGEIFSNSIPVYDVTNSCRDGNRLRISLTSPIVYPLGSTGILSTRAYSNDANCTIVLEPWMEKDSILLSIRMLDIRPYCQDNLKVTDTVGRNSTFCSFIHDENERQTFISHGPMIIRFIAGRGSVVTGYRGFQLVFTTFRTGIDCDTSMMFNCHNGRCISKYLRCDGHNHCGDRSDSLNCVSDLNVIVIKKVETKKVDSKADSDDAVKGNPTSVGAIVGYVFGGIFLVLLLCCLALYGCASMSD